MRELQVLLRLQGRPFDALEAGQAPGGVRVLRAGVTAAGGALVCRLLQLLLLLMANYSLALRPPAGSAGGQRSLRATHREPRSLGTAPGSRALGRGHGWGGEEAVGSCDHHPSAECEKSGGWREGCTAGKQRARCRRGAWARRHR